MKVWAAVRMALASLRVNKLRTALTMLGIVIGVAAVIAMVSVGAGAQERIAEQIRSMGSNLIVVFPGAQTSGGIRYGLGSQQTLTEEDARAIALEVTAVGGRGAVGARLGADDLRQPQLVDGHPGRHPRLHRGARVGHHERPDAEPPGRGRRGEGRRPRGHGLAQPVRGHAIPWRRLPTRRSWWRRPWCRSRRSGQPGANAPWRRAAVVDGDERVAELSRMLAGVGDSSHARRHAAELLETAGAIG